MTKMQKLGVAAVFIIAAAIIIGFAYDGIVTAVERKEYPQGYKIYVEKYSLEYGVPQELVYAVIKVESDYDPDAQSSAGAVGLMQLLPSTFRWLTDDMTGEKLPDTDISKTDVNIKYGTYYLSLLYHQFGSWDSAVCAYIYGPGSVSEWLKNPEYSSDGVNLKYIPERTARNYVRLVNESKNAYVRLYSAK